MMAKIPTLENADGTAQRGVAVETGANYTRIVIDPPRGWRMWSKRFKWSVIVLAFLLVWITVAILSVRLSGES
jgi:hypothetical protein